MEKDANSMSTPTTQVPIPLVDIDKLPREKGWSYDDITRIVGNLYLESRKRVIVMDEQFHAVVQEYQQKMVEQEEGLAKAMEEIARLRKELERRNESRATSLSSSGGKNSVQGVE